MEGCFRRCGNMIFERLFLETTKMEEEREGGGGAQMTPMHWQSGLLKHAYITGANVLMGQHLLSLLSNLLLLSCSFFEMKDVNSQLQKLSDFLFFCECNVLP